MRKVTLAAFALLALAACVTEAPPEGERRGREAPAAATPDPARAADRQLAVFGDAHPQCQLWTNWQKMCSRTGAGGATICTADPDRPVPPSEPFCTSATNAPAPPPTQRQIESFSRFCRFRPDRGSEQFRACEGGGDRPFNGRRVAARLHPWCGLWADEAGALVCQSGTMTLAGVPRCEALARQGFAARTKLSCVSRSLPGWCRSPALLGDGPQYPFTGEHVAIGYNLGEPTVVGAFCERR